MSSMSPFQSVKARLHSYTHWQPKDKGKAKQVDPPQANSAVLAPPLTEDALEMSEPAVNASQSQRHQEPHSVRTIREQMPDPDSGDIREINRKILLVEATLPMSKAEQIEKEVKRDMKKAGVTSPTSEVYVRALYGRFLAEKILMEQHKADHKSRGKQSIFS